jgi:hypothetical protein
MRDRVVGSQKLGVESKPMVNKWAITVPELLRSLPASVRPIVQAGRKIVTDIAPSATEIVYMKNPPRSKTYMWKLLRYADNNDANVLGIGTFPKYSTIFFYRGKELDDGSGVLEGSGRNSRFITLRSAADAERPEVKRIVRRAFALGGAGKS